MEMNVEMVSVVGSLIVGAVIFLGMIVTIGVALHVRRSRLLTHAERMRAIELGCAPSDLAETPIAETGRGARRTASRSMAEQCFHTAGWTGFWAFGAIAVFQLSLPVAIVIGSAAGAIGVTALICGTVLAANSTVAPALREPSYKPAYDPDAFDVVSSRGR